MRCPHCGKALETVGAGKRLLMVCPDVVTEHPPMVYVPEVLHSVPPSEVDLEQMAKSAKRVAANAKKLGFTD
jgi:hypothetical protein